MSAEKKLAKPTMKEPGMDEPAPTKVGFTGIARSVQAYENSGFRNFRILTLHLENGVVKRTDYSDPYASFEAISRMELSNEQSIIHLNNNWQDGKTLSK